MKQTKAHSLYVISTVLLATGLTGCLGGSDEKKPSGNDEVTVSNVSMQFGATQTASLFERFILPSAYAAASDVSLCFKRLRFKQEGDPVTTDTTASTDEDNVDFLPGTNGLVALDPAGTSLGAIELAPAVYKRIEFDLEKECDASTLYSVRYLHSSLGQIETNDRITIKFEFPNGFDASAANESVTLGITAILDALDTAVDANGIKDAAESAAGGASEE